MIDSHAHLTASQFDADREAVAARCPAWMEVGTTVADSRRAVALAQQYDRCWATVGVHPDEIAALTDEDWRELEHLIVQPKVVAVGEVGFDFYRQGKAEEQRSVLQSFIGLAQQYNKPVVFHVRDPVKSRQDGISGHGAHEELIKLFTSYSDADRPRGVIHTFSGTKEQAEQYLKLGLYLSFSGVVTFKKAGEILDVAKTMPLEKMLIETDCPYLAPEPYRGKRNEPAYVQHVAQKIAEIRGLSVEEVGRATEENTRRLFDLR